MVKKSLSWGPRKESIDPQSWPKYLWTFSLFNTIILHHKWNGARLLSPESECTSCLSSWPYGIFADGGGGAQCPHKKKKVLGS